MKKYSRLTFLVLFAVLAVLVQAQLAGAAGSKALEAAGVYRDAILYRVNDNGILEFNVVYSADVTEAAVADSTGNGISSVSELKKIMGTIDSPDDVCGTDTEGRVIGRAVRATLQLDETGKAIKSLEVTSVRERPVIGISWKGDTIGNAYKGIAEAFERNGALAVYLPQIATAEGAREILANISGVFETGGEDWNPALYGEDQTPHGSSWWNDARDTSDLHLMQEAISLDVPLLAVCRGEQGLNIALGGGLIQDIPYYLGLRVLSGDIGRNRVTGVLEDKGYWKWNKETKGYEKVVCTDDEHYRVQIDGIIHSGGTGYHHLLSGEKVGILDNSKWLYRLVGSNSLELVATAHHQAVNPDKLGKGLTVVAYAADGIIEAIEYQNNLFALGLQWHPERDALKDTRDTGIDLDKSNAMLGALVRYAGVYADRKHSASGDSSSGCNTGVMLPSLLLLLPVLLCTAKKK